VAAVELLEKNRMRLSKEATLEDIYGETESLRLPVEPLSRKKTIVKFLREGGYGYGSLTEGELGSKILNLSWTSKGKSYTYGLENSTLYNAGYPLQRIVQMGRSDLLGMDFGQIEYVTFLTAEASSPAAWYSKADAGALQIPESATNAMFLNGKASSILGLPQKGLLVTLRGGRGPGEKVTGVWEKRFIEDSLPAGLEPLRILTVKSNLERLMDAAGGESYCAALATLKGFVLNLYCPANVKEAVSREVESLKYSYIL
jgi:hypothetical protein